MSVATPELYSPDEVVRKQNHYAKHRAEVNRKTEVIAIQDSYNQNGLLVTKAGSRMNNHTADRIIQHRLVQPLEEQVNLNQTK